MKNTTVLLVLLTVTLLSSCQTGEEAFIGRRLQNLCDESLMICGVMASCVLDNKHYVEGIFPGDRKLVINTDDPETKIKIRIYFSKMENPGNELWIQIREPDCMVNQNLGRMIMEDVDIFEKAGDDRMLMFELEVLEEGDHLLEIYSDAAAEFLLIVETQTKTN